MVHVRGRSQRQSGEKIRLACVTSYLTNKYLKFAKIFSDSRVAQWKRAGPITQRSEDQNLALLNNFFLFFFQPLSFLFLFIICFFCSSCFSVEIWHQSEYFLFNFQDDLSDEDLDRLDEIYKKLYVDKYPKVGYVEGHEPQYEDNLTVKRKKNIEL